MTLREFFQLCQLDSKNPSVKLDGQACRLHTVIERRDDGELTKPKS